MAQSLEDRLRTLPFGKALLSVLLLGGNFLFGYAPRVKTPSIAERVSLVRQALALKNELLSPPQAEENRNEGAFATGDERAQMWGNWGNWANWANFSNWANWANWANFLNR